LGIRHRLTHKKINIYSPLLPVLGIGLFIVLYIIAAYLYPGGSDADKTAIGFSWQHNYWCELLATQAQNGKTNTARPVAITAMMVLAISLIIFWYRIPLLFLERIIGGKAMQWSGIGSMVVLPLLLTDSHDMVINSAALLGCIGIIILMTNLIKHKMYLLFYIGMICLLLCAVNNYVYYTKKLLHNLPVIQKISFLIFLLWFVLLSVKLYRKKRNI
jgi:hypothetical protein